MNIAAQLTSIDKVDVYMLICLQGSRHNVVIAEWDTHWQLKTGRYIQYMFPNAVPLQSYSTKWSYPK